MWQQVLKDYFTFSRKERNAVIVLTVMIVLVILLPFVMPKKPLPVVDEKALAALSAAVDDIVLKDSGRGGFRKDYGRQRAGAESKYWSGGGGAERRSKARLFDFDPNRISFEQWQQLGLQDRTIKTILNYINKGGRFRKAADLARMYGLPKEDFERLMPYVAIAGEKRAPVQLKEAGAGAFTSLQPAENKHESRGWVSGKKRGPESIDINNADSAAWESLPGIGAKLSMRIIAFRERLGGFYRVEQVGETFGLADSTFRKILPLLTLKNLSIRKINVNQADVEILKSHPYIRWQIANAIVKYREQHGQFKDTEGLSKITLITPEILEKLRWYLEF